MIPEQAGIELFVSALVEALDDTSTAVSAHMNTYCRDDSAQHLRLGRSGAHVHDTVLLCWLTPHTPGCALQHMQAV